MHLMLSCLLTWNCSLSKPRQTEVVPANSVGQRRAWQLLTRSGQAVWTDRAGREAKKSQ